MQSGASRWRTVLVTVIAAYGLVILVGVGVIYSGAYHIGADTPHWGLTYRVFETARIRSIKNHAAEITPLAGLDDEAKILTGVAHFADHCAVCHGAPGVPKGEIAQGLYPRPPDLAVTAKRYTDAELFWIVKHGIKMTGMPSWADHGDAELWATVAFLKKLPAITPEEYGTLVTAAMQAGGHRMGGDTKGQEGAPTHSHDRDSALPHHH